MARQTDNTDPPKKTAKNIPAANVEATRVVIVTLSPPDEPGGKWMPEVTYESWMSDLEAHAILDAGATKMEREVWGEDEEGGE